MAAAAAAAEVVVAAEDDGCRALRFVLLHLRGVFGSRRAAVRAFHHAEIVVNGTAIRDSGRILHQGDKVEVRLDAERIGRQRDALDLPVVHEDVYIAVVWKGAGITETELQAALPYAFPESDVPTVCDCPDKNTYGLCLVAKDERTAGVMRAAVDASKLIRQSRVVVHGTPANTATALSDSVRCCCCVGCAPCCPLCGTATDAVAISPEQRRPPCDGYHVSVRHSTPTTSEAGVLSTCDVWWRSGPAATTIRRRFADAGQHIVGTVFNAKPTRGTSHKGGLYHAIVGLHFEHPVTREAIHVQHAEPAKFERMREREVMFLERARAQRDAELRDHGAAQGLEADDPSVPVAYVTGKKDFCGLVLKVTSNVLVPRASTAALVDAVQQLHGGRGEEQAGVRVLDLGTGSGGILLAILARLPGAEGAGIDVSEDAIALAQENASLLGLSGRASFAVADFGKLCAPDAELPQPLRRDQRPFDVVVCNPPYLPSSASMARASVAAEPALALYGGPEGLSCYRTIARSLASRTPPLLSVGGHLVLEVGAGQQRRVRDIFEKTGRFSIVATHTDSRHTERCIVFQWRPID